MSNAGKQENVRFPYDRFRRGQREVAEVVKRVVERGEVLLLRAPTGFGKTAAVIYGLLLAGVERVLYLVRTRNEIEPVLRELSRFGVDYVFLYSARRMCPLLRGERGEAPPPDEFWENCRLARLKGVCPYYENLVQMGDVKGPVINAVRRVAPSPYAAVRELEKLGLCPFFALKMLVDDVKFIVATYPYVFKRDIFESVFEPHEYSDYVIVVDEAHALMDVSSILEERLRRRDVEAFAAEVERYAPDSEWGRTVAARLRSILAKLKPPPEGRLRRINKTIVLRAVEDPGALADLAAEIRLEKFREALGGGASSAARIRVAATRVAVFASLVSLEGVEVFVTRGKSGEAELVALPVDHCVVTREPLMNAKAVILMSGTLPPERFIRDVLCVERRSVSIDTELLYGSNISGKYYTIVTLELTSRYGERSGEMYNMYASYVKTLAEELRGAILVVYPSYEFMKEIVSRLSSNVVMVSEERDTNIDALRKEVEKLLEKHRVVVVNAVAGGKLVEGVELTRDGRSLISAVMLAGVPYPQPDDYTKAVIEKLAEKVGPVQASYYVYTVTAYVKARQALGRAIRSDEDRAIYILGDRRYLNPRIRELLRLKYHRVVKSIEELREALRVAVRRLWDTSVHIQ
ncbi:helicase c2 [Pyrolobus fumarii 1A]|uniref:Helicase c2 n=1 Tax=Pyrolobus fumarii (strain DSM 11204 / 1A) TaxID=694429 RepID=G0EDG4_PYRF1|nr:ATP-dependent DNA helicase [Pyrolobus fumarii]AEM38649.1 helicase c2 [Pyrolobus fumarii 1A]